MAWGAKSPKHWPGLESSRHQSNQAFMDGTKQTPNLPSHNNPAPPVEEQTKTKQKLKVFCWYPVKKHRTLSEVWRPERRGHGHLSDCCLQRFDLALEDIASLTPAIHYVADVSQYTIHWLLWHIDSNASLHSPLFMYGHLFFGISCFLLHVYFESLISWQLCIQLAFV